MIIVDSRASTEASASPFTPPPGRFQLTPVIHARNGVADPRCRTFRSAVANALYLVREDGEDLYGPTPGFAAKAGNLGQHGRRGPIGCDAEPLRGLELWRAADLAALTDRPDAPVAWHMIGWLPGDGDEASWRTRLFRFLDEQLVANGMIGDWAIHRRADGAGGWETRPHVHILATARFWRGTRIGSPQPAWLTSVKRREALEDGW